MPAWRVGWADAQAALRDEVGRVTALLRSRPDPTVPALGDWNFGDLAMHLSQAWIAVPGLARRDLSELRAVAGSGTGDEAPLADVWDLADFSGGAVRSDPERDPAVLAGRIEERAEGFFAACAGCAGDEPRPWLVEGSTVDLTMLTCHLLNEMVMHGADLARAAGRPWPVPPAHAVLVHQGFLLPSMAAMDPRALVDQRAAAGVRATYEVRLRGGGRWRFVFDDGAATVEDPSDRRVDCYVSADPVAMLDVVWARRSQWSAIARGQLLAWGRRPWLGPKLRSMLRNP
ncbi:MAG TPA: SCP2 sterol-binding domain-containing protein [Acidimicrobiales bacterium]|nr:SCP2 sterol-binding domain-containing protein [Acidimicrobiales bacterium]